MESEQYEFSGISHQWKLRRHTAFQVTLIIDQSEPNLHHWQHMQGIPCFKIHSTLPLQ